MNTFLIAFGKILSFFSKTLNLGHGSTWPGHIALSLNPNFIKQILKNSQTKIIFIAGTNGKTTTAKLIKHVLQKNNKKVFVNESGANLLNGIASSILLHSGVLRTVHYDFAIFEVDENTLALALHELTPDYLIILNLFRDQLDRYGEINTISNQWSSALKNLPDSTTILLNADDPQISYLGNNIAAKKLYFGLDDKKLAQKSFQHASDSTYCPVCGTRLEYKQKYFSHLGLWKCPSCGLQRPTLDEKDVFESGLLGIYNKYNLVAAQLLLKTLGISKDEIKKVLHDFKPAFGRQEIIEYKGRKIQIFLSKNPTGFNESLRTVAELGAKHILIVLNDRIPDGRDVSWIWDIDFEDFLNKNQNIHVSGDRAYDMSLRLKYAHPVINHIDTYPLLNKLFEPDPFKNLRTNVSEGETLYILPTYSAMLEVRKLLTGKKIL